MTAQQEGKKPRLLVVDDEHMACRTLKVLFRRSFEVETALSVGEARKSYKLESFDAAIVDYHMPGETGIVLIEILKSLLPKERIFLTTADEALAGMDAGRYTYVAKPYDPKRFIDDVTASVSDVGAPSAN